MGRKGNGNSIPTYPLIVLKRSSGERRNFSDHLSLSVDIIGDTPSPSLHHLEPFAGQDKFVGDLNGNRVFYYLALLLDYVYHFIAI